MPTVLCFGDSNTHGTVPMQDFQDRRRYGRFDRWPGVMAQTLGDDWYVIEEGNGGRTTVHDDPIDGEHRAGRRILPALLESHRPLDAVIIMLGTNDMQARFVASASDVARGVERLVREVKNSDAGLDGDHPSILVVAPVPVEEVGIFAETFAGAAQKSRALAPLLAEMCARLDVDFTDAADWATVDADEGVHLSKGAHQAIGQGMATVLRNVI